jgi:hypothetical protein
MAFNKSDIIALFDRDPAQVSRAIEILGNNQREDELSSRSANHQNGIGFSSNWASSGTHLWQFVTGWDSRSSTNKWGRKQLTHSNWERARYIRNAVRRNDCYDAQALGRKIAVHHWRQLGALVTMELPVSETLDLPQFAEPEVDLEMIAIPADKVQMALAILKAAGII